MYLRFEDWSGFLPRLRETGVVDGGRIIKVYPSEEDPRIKFRKPSLVVVESSEEPLTARDVFDFDQRGTFTGEDLERIIRERELNEKAARIVRALTRFATREDTRFAYIAMQI